MLPTKRDFGLLVLNIFKLGRSVVTAIRNINIGLGDKLVLYQNAQFAAGSLSSRGENVEDQLRCDRQSLNDRLKTTLEENLHKNIQSWFTAACGQNDRAEPEGIRLGSLPHPHYSPDLSLIGSSFFRSLDISEILKLPLSNLSILGSQMLFLTYHQSPCVEMVLAYFDFEV